MCIWIITSMHTSWQAHPWSMSWSACSLSANKSSSTKRRQSNPAQKQRMRWTQWHNVVHRFLAIDTLHICIQFVLPHLSLPKQPINVSQRKAKCNALILTAFFSLVCDNVDEAHPMMTELTEYAPSGNMKQATYRPAVFRVAAAMANPRIENVKPAVMCHVLSCNFPEDQPIAKPPAPASRNGGHTITSVMVVLKPRVLTTLDRVSQVDWKRIADLRWEKTVKWTCRKVKALHQDENPGSIVSASLFQSFNCWNNLIAVVDIIANHSSMSELSFFWRQPSRRAGSIRQEKKSANSNHKCNDTLKNKEPRKISSAILWQTAHYTYHLQPEIPARPSSPSNTPAAIREEKPVAVIWAR